MPGASLDKAPNAMPYRHDIFVSYRRHNETREWIQEHLLPLLELRVGFELQRRLEIFVDTQLESGASWPVQLADALGSSRILLVLWSGNYLASAWCTEELSHMLHRERQAGLHKPGKPYGLIVPAFIHDGDTFPGDLAHIQRLEIQKCFNVRMARNSPRAEELDTLLTSSASAIAECVNSAPPWRKSWPGQAAAKLCKKLRQQPRQQLTLPKFTG